MESFEMLLGLQQRRLRIEPQQTTGTYKIYSLDANEDLLNNEQLVTEDIPADGLLGTIKVKSEKDFTFDGAGAFSGTDLVDIAAKIVQQASFSKAG